jgi:hypothetical protein
MTWQRRVLSPVRNHDVAAQGVEPHRLRAREALLKEFSARRAALLLRIPILIECAEQIEGVAVQEEASLLGLEPPEPNDPLDRIDNLTAGNQFNDEIVKVLRFRRPRLGLRDRE